MNTVLLTIFGFFSGIVSFYGVQIGLWFTKVYRDILPYYLYSDPIGYTAGVVFGLALAIYVIFFLPKTKDSRFIVRIFAWVIMSTVSYSVAYSITFGLTDTYLKAHGGFFADVPQPWYPFILGGSIGAFFMLIGFRFLLIKITWLQLILLTVFGGILGLSWFLGRGDFNETTHSVLQHSLFLLYVIWQTGMAFGLGWCLDRNKDLTAEIGLTG